MMTCETSETTQKNWDPLGTCCRASHPKALAEITVYNVNAIHELFSENELAAKKIYHNKKPLYSEE